VGGAAVDVNVFNGTVADLIALTPAPTATDAGTSDAGGSDAGSSDAGAADGGAADAGADDGGVADAGADDAGTSDAGTGADAGASDAGTTPDAGGNDAGTTVQPPLARSAGCSSTSGAFGILPLLLIAIASRRRRA
jgi:uncharacterized protein (TIGR03382 family)